MEKWEVLVTRQLTRQSSLSLRSDVHGNTRIRDDPPVSSYLAMNSSLGLGRGPPGVELALERFARKPMPGEPPAPPPFPKSEDGSWKCSVRFSTSPRCPSSSRESWMFMQVTSKCWSWWPCFQVLARSHGEKAISDACSGSRGIKPLSKPVPNFFQQGVLLTTNATQ
jgi:hypothetical protein